MTSHALTFFPEHSETKFSYSFVSVISIVETIRALFSPSLDGISSVPIAILLFLGLLGSGFCLFQLRQQLW